MSEMNHPVVGVAVFVVHDGKALLLKRVKEHGQGTWGLAGGHLEVGETFEECARREVFEETGIQLDDLRVCGVTNDLFEDGKHYVTVFVEGYTDSADFEMKEPAKYAEYGWYDAAEFPQPLFLPLANFMEQMEQEGMLDE